MGDFKNQFNEVFEKAPSFSKQARNNVKRKMKQRKANRWVVISMMGAVATVFAVVAIWNANLLGDSNITKNASVVAAPEHKLKEELIPDVSIQSNSQFTVQNYMNSMNRGNGEYLGRIVVEKNFNVVTYGQVLLLEANVEESVFQYEVGRVIGLGGDKVAIKNGQVYLNDAPISTFYGKSQILGSSDVQEAFERLRRIQATELEDTIKEALTFSMDEYTLKDGELFILSDNWAKNSVRKVINERQIEGVILGYSDSMNPVESRGLSDEEFETIKSVSEQVVAAFEVKDKEVLKGLLSTLLTFDETNEYILGWDGIDKYQLEELAITDEVGDSFLSYIQYVDINNNRLRMEKRAAIAYKRTDNEGYQYVRFRLENDEWKFIGMY
jgi:signal peptidase I